MIAIEGLAVRQGSFRLSGISLRVPTGHYATLMGKSGQGKTTLLEVIAGLRSPACGTISLMGRDATRLRPRERQIGYVPQDGALFPTMTVRDNLGFALAIRGISALAGRERIVELAEWLGVAHLLERKPAFLSGGEKQRVALGRALACRPPILLFDEPLASLDDETRDRLVERLILLRQSRDFTVLHVTHSRSEAQRLGDCHFEIEGGSVRQIFPTNASGF